MWADLKVKPFGYGGAHSVRHSAISDALHKAGVLAAPYWIMLILMFGLFMQHHLYRFGKWLPFIMLQVVGVVWNAFSSPFSGRSAYCFIAAIALLVHNHRFMERWRLFCESGNER